LIAFVKNDASRRPGTTLSNCRIASRQNCTVDHFFSRRRGYATTLCNLKNHKVYDVVPGRSELFLKACLQRLQGKSAVQPVAMDLSATYRSIVRKHFPNARIVAARFHVILLVNHHFLP